MKRSVRKSVAALKANVECVQHEGVCPCFWSFTILGEEAELRNAASGGHKSCVREFKRFWLRWERLVRRNEGGGELYGVRVFERGLRNTRRWHVHMVTNGAGDLRLLWQAMRGTRLEGANMTMERCYVQEDGTGGLRGYMSKEMMKGYGRQDGLRGRRWGLVGRWPQGKRTRVKDVKLPVTLRGSIWRETMQEMKPRTRAQYEHAAHVAEKRYWGEGGALIERGDAWEPEEDLGGRYVEGVPF
jgi:hypothetical protein